MDEIKCPVCSNNRKITLVKNKKTPLDFGFDGFNEYRMYSCPNCLAEFAYPRKPLVYNNVDKEYVVYHRFTMEENREGQIYHTINCTSHWKDSPIVFRTIANALDVFGAEPSFLDFGAGSGYMAELARRLGYRVSALEPCDEFREFIHKTTPDVTLYQALEDIGTKFDLICAMHVVEHLPSPVDVICRLRQLLSDRGILILVVPNLDRAYYRFNEVGLEIEDQMDWDGVPGDFPPHHLTRFRSQTIKIALNKSGFSEIAIGYALVNAWDLFYTGLGDRVFRFKDYSRDIVRMQTIALVEKNLNEMLLKVGLDNLGNSIIALSSNKIPAYVLDGIIKKSREEVINQYVNNMTIQYQQHLESVKQEEAQRSKRISDLDREASRLRGESTRIPDHDKTFQGELLRLRSKVDRLEKKLDEIKNGNDELRNEIFRLRNELNSARKENTIDENSL